MKSSVGMSQPNCATSTISKLNTEVNTSFVKISEIAERRNSSPVTIYSVYFRS